MATIGDQFLDQLGARSLVLDQDFGGVVEVLLLAHRALEPGIFEPLPQQTQQIDVLVFDAPMWCRR
jgi:hypothetical protein